MIGRKRMHLIGVRWLLPAWYLLLGAILLDAASALWAAPPATPRLDLRRLPPSGTPARELEKRLDPTAQPLREGGELTEELGSFSIVENRVVFTSGQSKRRFTILENLCLERIARNITDNPTATTWVVSGQVSEYRNANYLLLRRAMVVTRQGSEPSRSGSVSGTSKTAPPSPGEPAPVSPSPGAKRLP